jgi:hypothetical protein
VTPRIDLGTRILPSGVQSNNLVADEIVARFDARGNGILHSGVSGILYGVLCLLAYY